MEETEKDSKTEDPTEKRIKDSVADGNVPVSREISNAASLLAFCAIFLLIGESTVADLSILLGTAVDQSIASYELSNKEIEALLHRVGLTTALLLGPIFLVLTVTAFISSAAQNELRFVTKRITPQYSRVSVIAGWKRLFSLKAFVEFLKSIAKISAASVIVFAAVSPMLRDIINMMYQMPSVSLLAVSSMIASTIIWISGAAALIAAADFAWQRHIWWSDMKMSRQDVKDEFKQSEGDPVVKSRILSIGRDRARSRMISAIPTATLIVANPTHYAIALRYDADRDAAPLVVAKGMNMLALRIREIAEANSIPVFERVDLARSLYKTVKVDQIIPQQFYKAIAELIRIIYNKRIS